MSPPRGSRAVLWPHPQEVATQYFQGTLTSAGVKGWWGGRDVSGNLRQKLSAQTAGCL